jgi:hypothetical protein
VALVTIEFMADMVTTRFTAGPETTESTGAQVMTL